VDALAQVEAWPVQTVAVGVLRGGHEEAAHGPREQGFRWASVTKLATALATLIAAEEGVLDLDQPAGPPGSTVRHLLAHASGLPFEGRTPIGRPGQRRIYSNSGFEVLAEIVGAAAEMPFAEYLRAAVLGPLELRAELRGSPAAGLEGTLDDLVRLGAELQRPRLVAPETLAEATSVQFPGLVGVLPDVGRMDPNATLDRLAELTAHVRPLRRQRRLPLGRPRRGRCARVPGRPRLRAVGARGVAAPR